MQFSAVLRYGLPIYALLIAGLSLPAQTPDAPPKDTPAKDLQIKEGPPGMPARATPGDYLSHVQAGNVTIAAEYTAHSVATPDAIYNTEDYVVVEVGFFGPPGARLNLSQSDFSLRINGKKDPAQSQPVELVLKSLKDPQWEPPPSAAKSKTSIGTGGQTDAGAAPPPPRMPFELRRPMELRVQKASMPEGNRALPQAGLLFFSYRGKAENVRSLELIYNGAAGKTAFALQP